MDRSGEQKEGLVRRVFRIEHDEKVPEHRPANNAQSECSDTWVCRAQEPKTQFRLPGRLDSVVTDSNKIMPNNNNTTHGTSAPVTIVIDPSNILSRAGLSTWPVVGWHGRQLASSAPSRRRDCHSTSLLKHLLKVEGGAAE